MADAAVASILQPVIDAVVKLVGAVIKRQCNYLCCFTSNIDDMKVEAETLDDALGGVQRDIERERENAQDIVPAVETWLTKSNDFKGEVDGILNEVPNVESGCLRITARYSLSKKAVKIAQAMKEHREEFKEIKSNGISKPKPPAAMVPIHSAGATYEFESRKQIEEKIMTVLKGEERDVMIGICGMGGLGKTFMANKIRNRVLKEHMFDEVVMVVVSQQVDESKIQLQIAEQLGLKLEEQTLLARANRIRERLNDSKRTLLILDDIWECLKLVELGIPCDSEGCRFLFTSRNSDALRGMDVGKVFGMEILSKEEAWLLFKGKAGECVDNMKLNSIANEVVKECKGLPIALVTVGAAMKDEMDERIWKDASKQLMKANPKNIPYFIKDVYNPIEVSYTKLASEEAKSVFLLCCLFPEDADIHVDNLTYFCMGLHIFEDVKSLEEARNRMRRLIKMLKNQSLLLDSEDTDCVSVRMHDIVRDVCIFIAKQKGYIDCNGCKWISSFERCDELLVGLDFFPNLSLLLLNTFFTKEGEEIKINNINTFYEGIRDLYVLSMHNYPWTSLPPTQSLKNLGTLIFYSCWGLETISFVGELVNLEILICCNCNLIEELPMEIGRLKRLKLLDLTRCQKLQSIGRGIISNLVGLEELKMVGSFRKWEADDKERNNAGLIELEFLKNLSCLEIEIENPTLAAADMRLSTKLERFHIYIPHRGYFSNYENNVLVLEWVEGTCLGYWIQMQLLRDTQRLVLSGAGVNNVELAKIPNNIYASLFTKLSTIKISGCPCLHNLRQLSIAGNDCFPRLEYLEIFNCEVMEQVFLWSVESMNYSEVRNHRITKIFPKLNEVHLWNLPNLTTFCQGIEGIDFPLLGSMSIRRCPKMTSMISTTCLNGIGSNLNNSGGTSSVDGGEKVSFGNCFKNLTISANETLLHSFISSFNGLEELRIGNLSSMCLFTSSIVGSLVCLRNLYIHDCDEMVKVIQDDDDEEEIDVSGGERRTLVFPNLQSLVLMDLCKLVTFCESKCDVEFPSLTSMEIRKCPNMTNFTLGRLIAPIWEAWTTDLEHCHNVSFGNCFKNLTIAGDVNLFGICHSVSSFNRLEVLTIGNLSSMSLFTSSIVGSLVCLKKLYIYNCGEMLEVIQDDDDDEEEEEIAVSGGERTLVFPNLQSLALRNLPKLVTFCNSKCDVEFPSLTSVKIKWCHNMTNFTLGRLIAPIWEVWETNLDHCVDVASMKMKKLTIQWPKYPLCHHKISESFFTGLDKLSITKYKGTMSLFSSSIVRNLINLRDLDIDWSDMIIQVIKDDDEKEKVASGGEKTSLFPKLERLSLMYLLKLVTFCEWNCDVELPSLKKVKIYRCPNMTNFTLGSLTTPILADVIIDYEDVGATKDLNGLLQQRFDRAKIQIDKAEVAVIVKKKLKPIPDSDQHFLYRKTSQSGAPRNNCRHRTAKKLKLL